MDIMENLRPGDKVRVTGYKDPDFLGGSVMPVGTVCTVDAGGRTQDPRTTGTWRIDPARGAAHTFERIEPAADPVLAFLKARYETVCAESNTEFGFARKAELEHIFLAFYGLTTTVQTREETVMVPQTKTIANVAYWPAGGAA